MRVTSRNLATECYPISSLLTDKMTSLVDHRMNSFNFNTTPHGAQEAFSLQGETYKQFKKKRVNFQSDVVCDFSESRDSQSFCTTIDSIDLDIKSKCSLGRGSYSNVFEAAYKQQQVAVKKFVLLEEATSSFLSSRSTANSRYDVTKAFQREVSTLSGLNHENVIRLIGASKLVEDAVKICVPDDKELPSEQDQYDRLAQDANLFIVSEICTGGDLHQFVLDHPKCNIPQSLMIAVGVAQGMKYLHSRKSPVFHRDLKLKNILLRSKECLQPVIADFGSAFMDGKSSKMQQKDLHTKEKEQEQEPERESSLLLGTMAYMSPELFEEADFTAKCDVYSFGIVLWELLTRNIAYKDMKGASIMFQVISGRRPYDIIDIKLPQDLQSLVESCLAQDPQARPSFTQIVDQLEDLELTYGLDSQFQENL